MTQLKAGLLVLVLGGGAVALVVQHRAEARLRSDLQALRQQVARLQEENQGLSNRCARAKWAQAPRLPAPPPQAAAHTNRPPAEEGPATNLFARFQARRPKLSPGQLEAYLTANGRSAASLLSAWRSSGDRALLQEAMATHAHDPQVAFEAAFAKELAPEQRRAWLEAFKQAAPENALANYLSAQDYLKAGQMEQAVQELSAAAGKSQFQDYTPERVQNDQEAYLSAGYSAAEAHSIAQDWLELPHLAQVRELGRNMVALANAYSQSGDAASAQAALQMALNLGQRYSTGPANAALISQLVGLAVERSALEAMEPASPCDPGGQTAQERLNQIAQQRAALRDLGQQAEPLLPRLSDQQMLNYVNRRMLFGEVAAMQWLVSTHGQR